MGDVVEVVVVVDVEVEVEVDDPVSLPVELFVASIRQLPESSRVYPSGQGVDAARQSPSPPITKPSGHSEDPPQPVQSATQAMFHMRMSHSLNAPRITTTLLG